MPETNQGHAMTFVIGKGTLEVQYPRHLSGNAPESSAALACALVALWNPLLQRSNSIA